jgi:eukaryotic-like serine/threonine-protein kinase
MAIQSGTHLGPYEILGAIGAGGMGEVYRARDAKLGRDVALKVLPEAFARDAERMARFQREAKVLASLNHPNIASIYGLEDSGSTHALVMELVEGPTLADRIKSGPIPISEALPIAKQMCDALEYAHEHGIVHRDLKPANVKVTNDDAVKVLDFGLAKALEGDASSIDISTSPTISRMATQAGVLLGTAAYMSPEQAKGKAVDRRADIWAFGCVLYEMLTGQMAFRGESVTDTLAAVIKEEPDWSGLPAGTPIRVRVLLQRCLQKDSKQRLRDIGDARIALDEVLSGAPEPTPAAATPAPALFWRRALPWVLAAVLTVALATTVWVSWRQRPVAAPLNQFVLLPPEKAAFGPNGGQPAISPDGRQIVFTATDARGTLLWLRPLDSLDARPLAGSEDAGFPFWSPDSGSIAFFAHGKLLRIDLHGGPPQTIAENVSFPLGGTWGRDGVIAFTPRVGGLYRVLASGGEGKPISQAGHIEVFPSFLPDGRHFLFARSLAPTQGDQYVGSIDSKDAKLILPGAQAAAYAPPGYLLFVRGGTLMAQPFDLGALSVSGDPSAIADSVEDFSVSEVGTLVYTRGLAGMTHLVWVDRAGKQISEAAPPGKYDNMQLSSDGKRVAFDGTNSGNLSIWIRDLERGTQSRLTFQPSNVPQWSPDGSTLVFAWIGGLIDLGERPANMSEAEKVLVKLSAPPIMFPSDWSSDGRYLVYYRTDTNSKNQLWVLPMFGDRKPFPFLHSEFDESQGQVSPDGKWIAYVSDESGAPQICVTSFPTPSGIQQISTAGGAQPRWRRDGKELFYLALNDQLMAVTVRTSGTFQADSSRALFETRLPVSELRQAYSVSPDGQQFLLAVPTGTASPSMTLVQNWQALLKK